MNHNADGLSILVPLYNQDGVALATALSRQVGQILAARGNPSLGLEIVFADDSSPDAAARRTNASIAALPHCRYMERKVNVGRAAIRNVLAKEARYSRLLFLDGDVVIEGPDFIQRYLTHMCEADVVMGTLRFANPDGRYDRNLKYRYERHFLARHPIARRMERPYASFRTTNFMVRRAILLAFPFDETFHEYGYEDTLFGRQLYEHGVSLVHIDNAATIDSYEDNAAFVAKTEESLRTLAAHARQLQGYSTLLEVCARLRRRHLLPVVASLFRLARRMLLRNLQGTSPSVLLFNVYKLGMYALLTRCAGGTHQ